MLGIDNDELQLRLKVRNERRLRDQMEYEKLNNVSNRSSNIDPISYSSKNVSNFVPSINNSNQYTNESSDSSNNHSNFSPSANNLSINLPVETSNKKIVLSPSKYVEYQNYLNSVKPNTNYEFDSSSPNIINHSDSKLDNFINSNSSQENHISINHQIKPPTPKASLMDFLQTNNRGNEFNPVSNTKNLISRINSINDDETNKLDKKLKYKMELDAQNEKVRQRKQLEKDTIQEQKVLNTLKFNSINLENRA